MIAFGGKLMTDYNLEIANIEEEDNEVTIRQGNNKIHYCLKGLCPVCSDELKNTIGALDRAYSVMGNTLRVTQIQREKWPIQFVNCNKFDNSFFKTANFEGAFRVMETIYYDWMPAKAIGL
jgi:hypothetical protein